MGMRTKLAAALVVLPFALVIGLSLMANHLNAQRAQPSAAAPGAFFCCL